jgi:hypothetical protein
MFSATAESSYMPASAIAAMQVDYVFAFERYNKFINKNV